MDRIGRSCVHLCCLFCFIFRSHLYRGCADAAVVGERDPCLRAFFRLLAHSSLICQTDSQLTCEKIGRPPATRVPPLLLLLLLSLPVLSHLLLLLLLLVWVVVRSKHLLHAAAVLQHVHLHVRGGAVRARGDPARKAGSSAPAASPYFSTLFPPPPRRRPPHLYALPWLAI
eukprot:GHVU01077579.1.p1 GENE.GHVU01077579.1~~GHVU01077579.1.p1  ORF type:complete len:171 (-),score=15.16 GHVU01077579.1:633-1145(-)